MINQIVIKDLSKEIKNNKVLQSVNVSFSKGHIYGIVGSNGSGKTMLLRVLGGLIKPTEGSVTIDSKTIEEAKQEGLKIGMIIENASLYPEFTGLKNLEFLAKINNYIDTREIKEAIERVGLEPYDKRSVRKYSLGMKQRIAMAQAIMEHPDLLLLDEPTNALDEEGIKRFRTIIMEEAKRGALVIVTSHNKEDIELLCDVTYSMQGGHLKGNGGMS